MNLEDLTKQGQELMTNRRNFLKAAVALAVAGSCTSGLSAEEEKNGVQFGMVIDTQRCIGCRACMVACKSENHTPPSVFYNVVKEQMAGTYPNLTRRFYSRPCMQCAKPSCIPACPFDATYKRKEDGIVVIDYEKCTGCQKCIPACPYGARSFDEGKNYVQPPTPYEKLPSPEYGEMRIREQDQPPIEKARKCTFCLHRRAQGLNPACAETCIGHAIHFGDVYDPDAKCLVHGEKLQELMGKRKVIKLKEEKGTDPSVYYLA